MKQDIKRGEIWLTKLDPVQGNEQAGTRPVLIIQDNILNTYSPVTIGFCLTSQINKIYPSCVELLPEDSGLKKPSIVMTNQLRTLAKERLIKKLGQVNVTTLRKIEKACLITLGFR